MLQQTFVHIPGIGKQTELGLWEHGIRSWDDAERFEKRFGLLGARLQKKLDEYIPRSREALLRKDAAFFCRLSSLGEAWRVFPSFTDECVYLDIETTGLSPVFDTVTVVGLYDGRRYKVFVEGENLQDLPDHLRNYSVVILGIPRKKASLQELKWGLSRAGITGDFMTAHITHDEVDAITSALVGLFYLADDFIALGTKTEEYLIVPRSAKFNYAKLAQIAAATGLDAIPETSGPGVESAVHGQQLQPAAG
jgi:RNase H-like protein